MTPNPPVRVTLPMLHATYANFTAKTHHTPQNRCLFLAFGVLNHFFGRDWVERHLENPGYLQIDETNQDTMDVAALRVIDLAECVYNFQHIENFDGVIQRMKEGHVEATAAELDLGRMLFLNHVSFRYIKPQGVKGKDYDAEITFPDGLVVCADAKCAMERSDMKEKAISNKLEKARQKLPSDKPGMIFAKVPAHWMDEPDFAETTIDQANELFRQSQRIVSIKFYVAPTSIKDGYATQLHAYKELNNPKTRFGSRDWTLFRPFDQVNAGRTMPAHWQRILFFPDGPPYIGPPPAKGN